MRSTYRSGPLGHFFNFGVSEDQLLRGLPPEAVEAFAIARRTAVYPKGSIIFAEGQPPQGVYLLGPDRARLSFDPGPEGARVIRITEPGEVLGLSETIANMPYEVSVETLTDCHVGYIKPGIFLRLLHEQPEICFRVVQLLGQNLHISDEQFRHSEGGPSVAARLAHFLFDQREEAEESDSGSEI